MPRRYILVIAALFALAGCDSVSEDPSAGPGVVNGIDLDPLFAEPTLSEIRAVQEEWQGRDTSVQDYTLILSEETELARNPVRVEVVSHVVTGQTHYGAVIVPRGASPGSLPVLMYLHGGDDGVSVDGEVDFVLQLFGGLRDDFVVVVPSFRDEPLRYGGREWMSEGPASPWNYDVDDAIALLNVAVATVPEVDEERVAAFGMSRGGAVAMLMSARDSRVDQVLQFFGPTDFFGAFVQQVAIEALQGNPRNLPGLDYMNANYLEPLARGELTAVQLRPEIIRRSAVLFVDDMAPVQMHHGELDEVVPVSQARLLMQAMDAAGKQPTEFQGYLYPNGEHNPISLPGAFDRVIEILTPMVNR